MMSEFEILKDFLNDMEPVIVDWEKKDITCNQAMKKIVKLWLNA